MLTLKSISGFTVNLSDKVRGVLSRDFHVDGSTVIVLNFVCHSSHGPGCSPLDVWKAHTQLEENNEAVLCQYPSLFFFSASKNKRSLCADR